MAKIVYQGIEGAFSDLTARAQFGSKNIFIGKKTFKDVFQAIVHSEADFGVVPIENSLAGSIYENYDNLNTYDVKIIAETYTRIEHYLVGLQEDLRQIKQVYSHPKALEQCQGFFAEHPWMEAVASWNTAAAAKELAEKGTLHTASISSKIAAQKYGLKILQEHIEDDPYNYTRFITISRDSLKDTKPNKCSLLIQLKHQPGALAMALQHFAKNDINLTKIESRPIHGQPFHYLFYIDVEFQDQDIVRDVLYQLNDAVDVIKILGYYETANKSF